MGAILRANRLRSQPTPYGLCARGSTGRVNIERKDFLNAQAAFCADSPGLPTRFGSGSAGHNGMPVAWLVHGSVAA